MNDNEHIDKNDFKMFFESINHGIIVVQDEKIVYINRHACDEFGAEKKNMVGRHFLEFITPEHNKILQNKYSELILDRQAERNFEVNIINTKGERRNLIIRLSPTTLNGKIATIITMSDNTISKQENRLQSVVFQISNATQSTKNLDELYKLIHKLLMGILDVTNFYIAHYDDKEKLLSFPFYRDTKDEFPEGFWPLGKGLTEYIIKTGKSLLLTKNEIKEYEKRGEIDVIGTMPELWMGAPLITKNRVIGVIALNSYHDSDLYTKSDLKILTFVSEQIAKTIEHKQAEDVLATQRKRLADILEGTNAGTWDWNVQTGELTLNERWAEIIGYTLKELEPIDINTWINNVHTDDLPVANALLDKNFNRETNYYYDVVFRQPHKDGRWVWVNSRGKVIEWTDDDKPLRMSGIHIDITERRLTEEKLKSRNRELEIWAEVTTDRELKMLDLKKEINELLEKSGEKPKYKIPV